MSEILYADQESKAAAVSAMGVMAGKKCIDLYEKYSEEEIMQFCGVIRGLWMNGRIIVEALDRPVKGDSDKPKL